MKIPFFGKISLAAKVRLLFGLAVLLIVSAALFVPWDRMQRLVKEQDLAEARELATIRLLERCAPPAEGEPPPQAPAPARTGGVARSGRSPSAPPAGPEARTPGGTPPPATSAESADRPRVDGPAGLGQLWHTLRPEPPLDDWPHTEFLAPPPNPQKADEFLRTALRHFQANPDDPDVYQYEYRRLAPPANGSNAPAEPQRKQRVFAYVRALRITGDCVPCHTGETAAKQYKAGELVGLIYVRMPPMEPELRSFLPVNLALVLGAGTIAVILAVVVFYVIMKSLVLSPVRRLRRLADHIGEGDLAVRSTIRTGDEFERLALAFNSMLERLQVSHQQMRQINESLNSKMDELAQTNVALFESNRLKSEFLARVSHELRTPLNSIIGFAEVLREQMAEGKDEARKTRDDGQEGGDGRPAEQASGPPAFALPPSAMPKAARYAENILTSGRMLLELINDLLDLSKIEAGKMAVHVEKVVVRDLVEAVVNFMRPGAEKKNLQVTVQIDPELPLVETDGGKLQQILYNLFSNAVKFTPPRGTVGVRAGRAAGPAGDELTLAVSDTGPGIPPQDQDSIFEKFHQLDSTATREHGGTGLGLSISRELAHMLGGRLTLVSKLGEGSTFTLSLPLAPPPAREADRPAARPPAELAGSPGS